MTTPRSRLGNHENPMVRAHGLDPEGRACRGCLFRKKAAPGWNRSSRCRFRGPRQHLARWDACALYRPDSADGRARLTLHIPPDR